MARSHKVASAAGMRSGFRARRMSRRPKSDSLAHSPACVRGQVTGRVGAALEFKRETGPAQELMLADAVSSW